MLEKGETETTREDTLDICGLEYEVGAVGAAETADALKDTASWVVARPKASFIVPR